MPLTDADLLELLQKTSTALDEEAAWSVDADVDDRGRSKPSIPKADQPYFDAVTEAARAFRDLIQMVQARQAR